MRRVYVGVGQCGGRPEVVVHVQDVGQQRLGGTLLEVKLLHLVLHHDGLAGDLLAGAAHAESPRDPLQEKAADLEVRKIRKGMHKWRKDLRVQ